MPFSYDVWQIDIEVTSGLHDACKRESHEEKLPSSKFADSVSTKTIPRRVQTCLWEGWHHIILDDSIQSAVAAGTNGEGKCSKEAWFTVPVWKRWVYCKLLISLFQFICINTALYQFLPKWLWEQTKSASTATANVEPPVLSWVTSPGSLIHTDSHQ